MELLPNEILEIILELLPYPDKYACMQCYRNFHFIITSTYEYIFYKQVINNKLLAKYILDSQHMESLLSTKEINKNLSMYNKTDRMDFINYEFYYIFNIGIIPYYVRRHGYTWVVENERAARSIHRLKYRIGQVCLFRKDFEKICILIIEFLDKAFEVPKFHK